MMILKFSFAQTLPYNPLFDDTKVNTIYIVMDPDSLEEMYDELENEHEYVVTFIYDNDGLIDTVYNTGFRLRGNTSLFSAKKSFKVSFNTYDQGRKYAGVEKLNLIGSHNDPTMTREKLYFDVYNDFGLPVRRLSFVRVFINDTYYGLYTNAEEYDEIFLKERFGDNSGNLYKCLYGSTLTYQGPNPAAYDSYELQTNEADQDFSDLIHLTDVLNNTPLETLACELEKIFNVDGFLKIYAIDISTGHWDNYGANQNNYYLYHDQLTDKFQFLSYDCDNTFGIDWLDIDWGDRELYEWNFDGRPLVERLLQIQEYKDRFSYYINELKNTILLPENIFPHIDSIRDLIAPAALADVFRTYDYGYTYDDFLDGFDTNDIDGHCPYGVKNFISERNASSAAQLDVNNIYSVLKDETHVPLMPATDDVIHMRVFCFDDVVVSSVELFYSTDNISFDQIDLSDDGVHFDSLAGDGYFGATLPAVNFPTTLYYHILATDNSGLVSRYPVCDELKITVGYTPPALVVNEFLARNFSIIPDDAGEYEDYIEIFNASELSIYLGDKFLSDELNNPSKWKLPDMLLPGNDYLLLWADDEITEGDRHCSFKLDGDKDEVFIFDGAPTYFSLIDSVAFNEQADDISVGRLPNGTGAFTILPSTTPGYNNEDYILTGDSLTDNYLLLYANPSAGYLAFDIIVGDPASEITVGLFNLSGQEVWSKYYGKLLEGVHTAGIEIDRLESGIYFLRAVFDTGYKTYPLMLH